jgi:Spx/MgsR family transcriptional regulator
LLAEHDVEYERRDYFNDEFTVDELRALLDEIGMKPSEILSRRSRAYKDVGLEDRDLTEEELLMLMPENPTLLRRPIIVKDGRAVIGFNKDRIESLISE